GEFEAETDFQWRQFSPFLPQPSLGVRVIIDFGCGSGRMSCRLAQLYPMATVIGLEPTEELLALAPPHPRVEYRTIDPDRADFCAENVNLVLVHLVFGALSDVLLAQVAKKISRVLRADGTVVIVENTSSRPNSPTWTYRTGSQYGELLACLHVIPVAQ